MSNDLAAIDISGLPELVRIAEEVAATRTPRVLIRRSEQLAVLVPVPPGPARRARRKSRADYEAFLSSAGSWSDVDVDVFLVENAESRRRSSRPSVEL